MLNVIWFGLVVFSVLLAGFTGRLDALTQGAFAAARDAVMTIALPLAGLMALWLGFLRLAELSGIVATLANWMHPLLRRLFPDVPEGHPAMGAMLMNMAANMLGLGNAATPLGLRAMRHLETLNPHPGTATNAMCTFLAINTSSIQLIPATAVAILSAQGSKSPTAIVGSAFLATCIAAIAGISSVKFLQRLRLFQGPPPSNNPSSELPSKPAPSSEDHDAPASTPLSPTRKAVLLLFTATILLMLAALMWPDLFRGPSSPPIPEPTALQGKLGFARFVNVLSLAAIPSLLAFFVLNAFLRKIKVYDEFLTGAKEGWEVALRILPPLVAILVAVKMFREAGGIHILASILSPVLTPIGVPSELLPMILIRPLSGGATTGLFTELVTQFGPDSLIARTAATIFGSTETTFYVLAVYFGAVGIRNGRHSLPAGLIADAAGAAASIAICRWIFT